MFELTQKELKNWRSQFATSKQDIMGLRTKPFVTSNTASLWKLLQLSGVKEKVKGAGQLFRQQYNRKEKFENKQHY